MSEIVFYLFILGLFLLTLIGVFVLTSPLGDALSPTGEHGFGVALLFGAGCSFLIVVMSQMLSYYVDWSPETLARRAELEARNTNVAPQETIIKEVYYIDSYCCCPVCGLCGSHYADCIVIS